MLFRFLDDAPATESACSNVSRAKVSFDSIIGKLRKTCTTRICNEFKNVQMAALSGVTSFAVPLSKIAHIRVQS
jgi:hypothetical protein